MAREYNIPNEQPIDGKDEKGHFLKGHQWWKMRTKHGREKIFKSPEILLQAAYEYFKYNQDHPAFIQEVVKSGPKAGTIVKIPTTNPLSIRGLCIYLGVNTTYFNDFERGLKKDEEGAYFSKVISHIKDCIENQMLNGASIGVYKENLIARLVGIADKTNHDLTSKGESIKEDKPRIMKVIIRKAADPDDNEEETE